MNTAQNQVHDHNQFAISDVQAGDKPIDFRRYIGLLVSNWYLFALTLFFSLVLAYGINTYSERIYSVNASLLIKEDQPGNDLTGVQKFLPGGDLFSSQQNLQNEIGILKSFSLNYRVMQELPDFHVSIIGIGRRGISENRYYKNAPFIVVYDSINNQRKGPPVNIKITSINTYSIEINGSKIENEMLFGDRFNLAGFDFTLIKVGPDDFKYDPDNSNRFIFWFNNLESLANSYRRKLSITPVIEEGTLMSLSISGVVARQECEYLNKLMEVYIDQGKELMTKTAENTIEFIDTQIELISDSLTFAEKRLESFKLSNRMIDFSSEGSAIRNKLEGVTQEKVSSILQKQYYDYLVEYIKSKNESGEIISPSIMGVADPLLITLVERLAKHQTQKKQLKYNLSADQPAIGFIDSEIEDARTTLDENVRNSILIVERTLEDIERRISEVEYELSKLPVTERKLINIQRKFDLNNTVYTYMLEKRSEAGIAKASYVSNNRIIDRAETFNSARIKPTERQNYSLAVVLGLLIPFIYIFLIDRLHNKIFDKKDIELLTDAPIIGFIGHNESKNEIPVVDKPGSSLSESFRTIRTNLRYYLNEENKAIISVTSTLSGEGKTFISSNLSAIIASLGKKTLLVGLDLRRPRIHKIYNSQKSVGLSSYLIGECLFEDIITPTEVPNLFFTPSGPIPPNPSELIESKKMTQFIEKARKEFDFIILDTPPVAIVSDGLILGNFADINIFVVRQRFSYKNTLELIQGIYKKKELKNISIVINDINITGYYGYGLKYGYGFYEGYGYNYGYGNYRSYGYSDSHKYYSED
jgi:tyrosine-protein kinase Etk/Wzc